MNAIAHIASAAPALWFGNTLVTVKLSALQGSDAISFIEHRLPFGDSPPLHVHRNQDEVFHVLTGTLRFSLEGKTLVAGAGQTVLAPKGLPHSYRVESAEGAHVLTVTRGRDFEAMVSAASRPAQEPSLPPQSAPTPEAITLLARLCAENGIDIVGPPLT